MTTFRPTRLIAALFALHVISCVAAVTAGTDSSSRRTPRRRRDNRDRDILEELAYVNPLSGRPRSLTAGANQIPPAPRLRRSTLPIAPTPPKPAQGYRDDDALCLTQGYEQNYEKYVIKRSCVAFPDEDSLGEDADGIKGVAKT
ncbi:hypothetical protein BGX38DRAFT_1141097 [Terfezia claveryi]|nr:hypothetical protein BGX38DRAFT_1141097 [Terfezia claveryi]